MKVFNVLDRKQRIDRSLLIEASAGTGKTFAIENIVVRLLLEYEHTLSEILVVTFTRAATFDLKERVRSNLERALHYLLAPTETPEPFDYLKAIVEKGPEECAKAIRTLKKALFSFDHAAIFTIHGFCAAMLSAHTLEGDLREASMQSADSFSDLELRKILRDFFRTELRTPEYSQAQLAHLLKYCGSLEALEEELLKILAKGLEIQKPRSYPELLAAFISCMHNLKAQCLLNSEKIIAELTPLAPHFEKLCDRKKNIKPEVLAEIVKFATLFDQDSWGEKEFDVLIKEGLYLCTAFSPAHLKPNSATQHPQLISLLTTELKPLVDEARLPQFLLLRMAHACQQLLKRVFLEEELLNYDTLLKKMHTAVKQETFAALVRKNYKAVLIDEFQDTDPLQWQIFETLFLTSEFNGSLLLVGDPKQSIYAFRHADIYTYLKARDALGEESCYALTTNYRSHPPLITALNEIFNPQSIPDLIYLPKLQRSLTCNPILTPPSAKIKTFADSLGSLHFCAAPSEKRNQEEVEAHFFFPYFIKELARLHSQEGIALEECAFLVSDRYQAQRLADCLRKAKFPVQMQHSDRNSTLEVLTSLQELLHSVLHPLDENALKVALGGKIVRCTHAELLSLSLEPLKEKILRLRDLWMQKGFYPFFRALLFQSWHPSNTSIGARLLSQQDGEEFYQLLQYFVEQITLAEYSSQLTPEGVMLWLQERATQPKDKLQPPQSTQKGVQIITLHSSKGLEFDIVFLPGLLSRNKALEFFVPSSDRHTLIAVADEQDQRYQEYCAEIDAEKMRQLYVAFTRARYRTYVPLMERAHSASPGRSAPIELFSHKFLDAKGISGFLDYLEKGHTKEISFCSLEATHSTPFAFTEQPAPQLTEPATLKRFFPKREVHSFTSLTQGATTSPEHTLDVPHDFSALHKSAHTLPAGKETGNFLHQLLQHLSFEKCASLHTPQEFLALINEIIQDTRFKAWETVLAEMLFSLFKAPLNTANTQFHLSDLLDQHCYRELEFLHPKQENLLTGVIDLIFMHADKYYIIDWKSNWLGPSQEFYAQQFLEKEMSASDYKLQAEIYITALEKYLKIVDPRPFSEIFGGTFYLFLRGVNPHNSHGIYYIK